MQPIHSQLQLPSLPGAHIPLTPTPAPLTWVVKLLQHVGVGHGLHNLLRLLDGPSHALQQARRVARAA